MAVYTLQLCSAPPRSAMDLGEESISFQAEDDAAAIAYAKREFEAEITEYAHSILLVGARIIWETPGDTSAGDAPVSLT